MHFWLATSCRSYCRSVSYGIRTVAPFAIGAAGIGPARFFALNVLGAGLWAIVIGTLGYVFGHALEAVLADVKRYETWILAAGAVIGVLIWSIHFVRERRRAQRSLD